MSSTEKNQVIDGSSMSDEELKSQGLVRIRYKRSGKFKDVPIDLFNKNKGLAGNILKNYPGYLYSLDRERMLDTLHHRDFLSMESLLTSRKRIFNLIEAGVPPLWDKKFEGGSDILLTQPDNENIMRNRKHHLFPTIDFILQFGAGTYFTRRAWRAEMMKKGVLIGIGRANLQDIIDFRTYAMPKGEVNPILSRELTYWIDNKFDVEESRRDIVVDNTIEALYSIEQKLSDFSVENPEYGAWNGEDLSIVKKPVWYLFVNDYIRGEIVKKYIEESLDPKSPYFFKKSTGNPTFEKMNYLFEFDEDHSKQEEMAYENAILLMIDREDFSDMSYEMVKENRRGFERELLYAHIEDQYRKLQEQDPEFIFTRNQEINKQLKFSSTLYTKDIETRRFVDGLRIKYLMDIPDQSLAYIYVKNRKIRGGHANNAHRNDFSKTLASRLNYLFGPGRN